MQCGVHNECIFEILFFHGPRQSEIHFSFDLKAVPVDLIKLHPELHLVQASLLFETIGNAASQLALERNLCVDTSAALALEANTCHGKWAQTIDRRISSSLSLLRTREL